MTQRDTSGDAMAAALAGRRAPIDGDRLIYLLEESQRIAQETAQLRKCPPRLQWHCEVLIADAARLLQQLKSKDAAPRSIMFHDE